MGRTGKQIQDSGGWEGETLRELGCDGDGDREGLSPDPFSCSQAHLHCGLLRVCLHGLHCSQGPAALHDDPAVLWLSQGQDAQGCTALLAHLWGSQEWPRQSDTHHLGRPTRTATVSSPISPR